MNMFLSSSESFGIVLTLGMFLLATFINRRYPNPFTTPLFLATVFVIIILTMFDVSYVAYNNSAKYITYFLMPVTVCFAVPMYRHLALLRRYAWPILLGMLIGVISSVLTVVMICVLFGLGDLVARSLVSISVTTAIAVDITEELGGIIALTVSSVIVTGILGASVSEWICRKMGIVNPIARGLAIGNASHAAGTSRAMQISPQDGAASSLAIVLSGILTAIIAPLAVALYF